MSSRITLAMVEQQDEFFYVEFWREEFNRLIKPHGRNWRKLVKEVDSDLTTDIMNAVISNRGGIENTRRVVKALLKIEIKKEDKDIHISSKLKRHKLTVR